MKHAIFPVFLSGYPCSGRCTYCNAALVTGITAPPCLESIKQEINTWLDTAGETVYREIALYGNDVLRLPVKTIEPLLSLFRRYVASGDVKGIRTSLRPDSILDDQSGMLGAFATVEIGVPSMDPGVLAAINRGHGPEKVPAAMQKLKEFSISIGCQTMIGLPGATEESDYKTAELLASYKPDFVRIHPALVLHETALAKQYQAGSYLPLPVEEAVERCVRAWDIYECAGVKVVRFGFHLPEKERRKAFLAGPWHPAFGQLVRSRRWRKRLKSAFEKSGGTPRFVINRRDYSDAIGQKHSNLKWLRENCSPDFQIVCGDVPDGTDFVIPVGFRNTVPGGNKKCLY
jgi:histone acetyltransferase (RNA polymerase elongator complex component)